MKKVWLSPRGESLPRDTSRGGLGLQSRTDHRPPVLVHEGLDARSLCGNKSPSADGDCLTQWKVRPCYDRVEPKRSGVEIAREHLWQKDNLNQYGVWWNNADPISEALVSTFGSVAELRHK
jgi:hypothetical protein